MDRPRNAHREKECGEKKERTGEDVEKGFNGTKKQEAKARDNLTILSLALRSGETVTSRTFHRLSFGIVGACLDRKGRCAGCVHFVGIV
jgi:hypothetical protein